MSKTRKLSGLVSDSGPLADGLLSAADVGALPLEGGTLTGLVTFAAGQTIDGYVPQIVSNNNLTAQVLNESSYFDPKTRLALEQSNAYGLVEVMFGALNILALSKPTYSLMDVKINGSTLVATASGNVGIGTSLTGAATKLHVQGRGLFTAGSFDPFDGTASGVSISYDTVNNIGTVASVQTGVAEKTLRVRGNTLEFYANTAERMRINSAGNVGIGTSTPQGTLHVTRQGSVQPVPFGSEPQIIIGGSQGGAGAQGVMGSLWFASAELADTDFGKAAGIVGVAPTDFSTTSREGYLEFYTTPSGSVTPAERMRITAAGNVGIGTSSPGEALTIVRATTAAIRLTAGGTGSTEFVQTGGNGVARHVFAAGGQTAYVNSFDITQSVGGQANLENRADSPITFRTNSTERMRIDSSGNVGIGTSSPSNATLDVVGNSQTVALAARGRSFDNLSGIVFRSNNAATEYAYFQGGPTFLAVGVNNAERMRIDSSGNVGIGTSSPTVKLQISEGNFRLERTSGIPSVNIYSVQASGYTPAFLTLNRLGAGQTATPSGAGLGEIRFDGLDANGTYMNTATIAGSAGTNAAGGAPGFLIFSTAPSGSSAIERMRIDSSGDVQVGTTTSGGRFTSAASGSGTAGYFISSGSLAAIAVADSGTNGSNIALFGNGTNPNKYVRAANGTWEVVNSAYSATIISITNAGAAFQGNNSATWSVTSDIRIKTNVRQIGGALDKMMALKPCHFEYKNAVGETSTGFIAQEFEEVFPGHVKETPAPMQFQDFIEGENKTLKTIDANLVPYLVKAIQELKAEFDAYKATHP